MPATTHQIYLCYRREDEIWFLAYSQFFVLIRNISFFCKDLFKVIRFIYVYKCFTYMYVYHVHSVSIEATRGRASDPFNWSWLSILMWVLLSNLGPPQEQQMLYLFSNLSISLSLFVRKWNAVYTWSSLVACFIGFPVYLVREIIISLISLLLSLTNIFINYVIITLITGFVLYRFH